MRGGGAAAPGAARGRGRAAGVWGVSLTRKPPFCPFCKILKKEVFCMTITKESIAAVIGNAKTEKQIIKAIEKAGIHPDCYENATAESGYINFRFWTADGMIRVYRDGRGEIRVQAWTRTVFSWSGIPVFLSGGGI